MLDWNNRRLEGMDLIKALRKVKRNFLLLVFYGCITLFFLYCTSYDNKVKYFSKDTPLKKADRQIVISETRDSNKAGSDNLSRLPYSGYGFTIERRSYPYGEGVHHVISDFVIEYNKSRSTCTELYPMSSVVTFFSLGLIPDYTKCNETHTITSYYKQQKRKEYIHEVKTSTFFHLFVFWGLFLNNKEIEEEFSAFKKIALTEIHNDFSSIQDEDEKNKRLKEEESKQAIEDMAKSQKIKIDEILDLRDENTRKEFLLAWYNSKENPDIENNIDYSENEFKFQEDAKIFKDYRKYKYAITNGLLIRGEYDFSKKSLSISQAGIEFVKSLEVKSDFTGTVTRLLELKNSLKDSDTIKSTLSFYISSENAEKINNNGIAEKDVIFLSKFSPTTFNTTGKCKYPDEYYAIRDNEYKECKSRFENRKIKFKYLLSEPLKYRIVYDGEVYKNY